MPTPPDHRTAPQHRVLVDPSTGRPILMAPGRHNRPRDTGPRARGREPCPFCAGHEDLTPPETGRVAGEHGWTARAFANKYPASDWHEIIAEGADHTSHPSELSEALTADSLALWKQRIQHFEAQDDVRCAFLFKNVGHAAGSSIDHNHSQLLGLAELPPRLELELQQLQRDPGLYLREIDTAREQGRLIFEGEHHVVLSPAAPKMPFETWLLPRNGDNDFLSDHAEDLSSCIHAHFQALAGALDTPPFNSYLHRIPGEPFHWHIELQPRIGNVAGLELGADMYINSVTGEQCARQFREGLAG